MKTFIYSLALISFLFIASCSSDDTPPIPAPSADFSFVVDGKSVTFTNQSADAVTYSWDFGDGNTSADASPTHTFDANGSYVTKLTVTNLTGTDSKQAVLEIINVIIDGSFDDWSDIPESITPTMGTIKSVKFENLENNKLFIYVEGTTDLTPLTQLLIDVDNDKTTGAFIDWFYYQAGEDLLIEGSLTIGDDQAAAIYECAPCDGSNPTGWNWAPDPINTDIGSFMEVSDMITLPDGKAYELAIDLTALGKAVNTEGIGIAVLDIDLTIWGPIGSAPDFVEPTDNPEGTLFNYVFK